MTWRRIDDCPCGNGPCYEWESGAGVQVQAISTVTYDCGGTCGSATCNRCRAARGLGPSGVTPTKKPKADARKAAAGWRVARFVRSGMATVCNPANGDLYSTPDGALAAGKKRARAEREAFGVFCDGDLRWTCRADGSVDEAISAT